MDTHRKQINSVDKVSSKSLMNYNSDEESEDSGLCLADMLGLPMNEMDGSLFQEEEKTISISEEEEGTNANFLRSEIFNSLDSNVVEFPNELMHRLVEESMDTDEAQSIYANESIYMFPKELSIPKNLMRRITNELVHGGSKYPSDKSYETIKLFRKGDETISERRELTRFENFVNTHETWKRLCNDYIAPCISTLCGEEMVLFKEKLNLKPSGGSGFAPHLDGPSLEVALGEDGPSYFVTVMVAIDDMTEKNGCLKVYKGKFTKDSHVEVIIPEQGADPDSSGRAGAIEAEIAEKLMFDSIICKGGDIAAFNAWAPHRSSQNNSLFDRRAIFLTYTPLKDGDYHDMYYNSMKKKRDDFKNKMIEQRRCDHESELDALKSIPKI